MIDFGLYCDIRNSMRKKRTSGNTVTFDMVVEEQGDESAVVSLINGCDLNTVLRLTKYFDPAAPIQELLKSRLRVLRHEGEPDVIERFIKNSKKKTTSFYQYLVQEMEKKGFHSDPDFYNHIGMSRQTFAKLRRNISGVSRNHALLMAVGLGLNYHEAVEFMENAGYAFRKNDTRESIICYVMRNRKYDLMSMEEVLAGFGEKPLMDIT